MGWQPPMEVQRQVAKVPRPARFLNAFMIIIRMGKPGHGLVAEKDQRQLAESHFPEKVICCNKIIPGNQDVYVYVGSLVNVPVELLCNKRALEKEHRLTRGVEGVMDMRHLLQDVIASLPLLYTTFAQALEVPGRKQTFQGTSFDMQVQKAGKLV